MKSRKLLKGRKLLNGETARERPLAVYVQLHTKCPDKWVAVDLETRDVWHHQKSEWRRYKGILVIKDGQVLMSESGEAYNKIQETKDGKESHVCARPNRRRRTQHHKRQGPC